MTSSQFPRWWAVSQSVTEVAVRLALRPQIPTSNMLLASAGVSECWLWFAKDFAAPSSSKIRLSVTPPTPRLFCPGLEKDRHELGGGVTFLEAQSNPVFPTFFLAF